MALVYNSARKTAGSNPTWDEALFSAKIEKLQSNNIFRQTELFLRYYASQRPEKKNNSEN